VSMELGYAPINTKAQRFTLQWQAWAWPRLPTLDPTTNMRRWAGGPAWIPSDSQPLVRHRALDGGRRIVTNDRRPPRGFEIEYDLGVVHRFAQLGTQKLISTTHRSREPQRYFRTPIEGTPDDSHEGLGYVEEAPLPMLDVLELRRDPISNEEVLVAGVDDPLYQTAIHVEALGFVEGYPIQPRHPPRQPIDWGLALLQRSTEPIRWRHRYSISEQQTSGVVSLGCLWTRPGGSLIALHLQADGSLTSELLTNRPTNGRPLGHKLRWAAAPLGWPEGRPRAWALRAAASRLRTLNTERNYRADRSSTSTLLGYLRRDPAPGWSPLFSATHPALADQYVTRSELEATDMGYRVEGVLGYILDRGADRSIESLPAEVKWGSRFGQRRRYIEGPVPA
jgi:hypothetical protein